MKLYKPLLNVLVTLMLVMVFLPAAAIDARMLTTEPEVTAVMKNVPGWIAGWEYRKTVNVTGSTSDLTDYQVELTSPWLAGKMNADFSDIRFTAADGTTLLGYWMESYTASTSAVFWVKVPSIPTGGTTIYMYYGNSAAETTSNGENTFIFFDDFNDGIVGNQWMRDNAGSPNAISETARSNYLRLQTSNAFTDWWANVYNGAAVRAACPVSDNFEIVTKLDAPIKAINHEQAGIGIRDNTNANSGFKLIRVYSGANIVECDIIGNTASLGYTLEPATTDIYLRIWRNSNWYASSKTTGDWVTVAQWSQSIANMNFVLFEATAHIGGTLNADFDWVFVRNRVVPEPAANDGDEERGAPPGVTFSGTSLMVNGTGPHANGIEAYAYLELARSGYGWESLGNAVTESTLFFNGVANTTVEFGDFDLTAYNWIDGGDHRVYSGGSGIVKRNGVTVLTTTNARFTMDVNYTPPGTMVGRGWATIDAVNSDAALVAELDPSSTGQVNYTFTGTGNVVQANYGVYNFDITLGPAARLEAVQAAPVTLGAVALADAGIQLNVNSFTPGGYYNNLTTFFANKVTADPGGAPPVGIAAVQPAVYWDLGTVLGAINTDITFDLTGIGGLPEAGLLRVLKRANAAAPWVVLPNQTVVDETHLRVNGINSFSEFALGSLANVHNLNSGMSFPTIQSAISDAATLDGNVLTVEPGIYLENVNFSGKNITLRSLEGAGVTIIDGGHTGSAVSFVSGETRDAVLEGFTLTNGSGTLLSGSTFGGGVIILNGANPAITNCVITGNAVSAGGSGGGVYLEGGGAVITNTIVSGNQGGGGASGIAHKTGIGLTLTNCVINGNNSTYGGAVWANAGAAVTIINCTIVNNLALVDGVASGGGGGILGDPSVSYTVVNSILRDNAYADVGAYGNYAFTYSNIEGGRAGIGNVDADPLFVDAAAADYHLLPGSPCIDTGDDTAVPAVINTDLAGKPRITGDAVDMGAFEYNSFVLTLIVHGGGFTVPGADEHIYDTGSEVEISAIPIPGWVFSHWGGAIESPENPVVILGGTGDITVEAYFVQAGQTLIGRINIDPEAYEGQTVNIVGAFYGWGAVYGSPPVSRNDWVIADESGAVYVSGSMQGLKYPDNLGFSIAVSGVVRLTADGGWYISIARGRN